MARVFDSGYHFQPGLMFSRVPSDILLRVKKLDLGGNVCRNQMI
jgi:hypothetical protein